jgi:hypothetical protein
MEDTPYHTGGPLLLVSLAIAAGLLCALLLLGGTVALAALVLLVIVGFLIGFLNL